MDIYDKFNKLEQMRKEAGISQSEMATHLNISQSQVSRYEQEPDNAPMRVVTKWLQFCGDMAGVKGLEIDDPRVELNSRLQLIQEYASHAPKWEGANDKDSRVNEIAIPVNTERFLSTLLLATKKPRIAVTGQFDAGKSRFINTLLGGNRLPTAYQPATSIICLLRHLRDKPAFQAEDVWFFGQEFNFDRVDDKEHCLAHKMFAGGYESLGQYGTHSGAGKEHNVFAAVVYMDAPLLLGADVLDFPGYGNSAGTDDNERAEIANKMADVLVYASQATGFMHQHDLNCFVHLLHNLPVLKDETDKADPLRNVFIVATHAHSVIPSDKLAEILDKAASRCYRHLDHTFVDRMQQGEADITPENFRARFFTFSADDANLRSELEKDIKRLVTNDLPKSTLNKMNQHVLLAKSEASASCDHWIRWLQIALDEREKAQAEIIAMQENEPNRLHKKQALQKRIHGLIDLSAQESRVLIAKVFADYTSITAIEEMIARRYFVLPGLVGILPHSTRTMLMKKEAQQFAASYLVGFIQKLINDGVNVKGETLSEQIELFLAGYDGYAQQSYSPFASEAGGFNSRAAFMSAISGIGMVGALAAWAKVSGARFMAGSDWSDTVMAFVTAVGEPIVAAINMVLGIDILSLFGESWQAKLAKKIHHALIKEGAEQQMSDGVEKYWIDTKNAFEIAALKTEEAYQAKLKSLYAVAFTNKKEELETELKFAAELRFFFAGMPWRVTQN